MPRQRITFTRTETVILELEFPVDTFSKENAEFWANYGPAEESPVLTTGTFRGWDGVIRSEWKAGKSDPGFAFQQPEGEASASKVKRKR